MEETPIYKLVASKIDDRAMDTELAEMVMIKSALLKLGKTVCPYCKWPGHKQHKCPIYKETTRRCEGDSLRNKIRSRVFEDLRIADRIPLSEILMRHHEPGYR